ncbi:hypothetical protein LPH44_03490 [Xylella taiwanensis]|uniref:Uncharacterized protein n=2 Tax=Xylella taiwanensis TaxID=1444770 RepID=A0ABS8TTI5_9GAMM|nr:hypothetical protein [Xylella taiwanensis]MCD8456110.1 hypothetical protein [Xylella taiwanensis]MCD8458515.1 hypothetical protein [Xylella taiwanensis]MCD8465155.1 hypothetical protein [Xylella taiwanensis]MCD8473450.1 hypothetical protein [Xylella taiwanensis]UFN04966.1 hypothetical protein LPH41_02775 [Xylella taiwanensis]
MNRNLVGNRMRGSGGGIRLEEVGGHAFTVGLEGADGIRVCCLWSGDHEVLLINGALVLCVTCLCR